MDAPALVTSSDAMTWDAPTLLVVAATVAGALVAIVVLIREGRRRDASTEAIDWGGKIPSDLEDPPTVQDLVHQVGRDEVERWCPWLLKQHREGDELWYWHKGIPLAARSGYALVRNRQVVESCGTLRS